MLFFVRFNRITGYWEAAASNNQGNGWITIENNGEKLKINNKKLVKQIISNKTETPVENIEILITRPQDREECSREYYR